MRGWLPGSLGLLVTLAGCAPTADPVTLCGPAADFVDRVIDGDTVALESGELVRYLLVDAPEIGEDEECHGALSADFNARLVEGAPVELAYDVECRDRYGRLLAHVYTGNGAEVDVGALLPRTSIACEIWSAEPRPRSAACGELARKMSAAD